MSDALFPPIEPHRSGMLPVDDLHTIYWEECGNPQGQPVIFLHGGPGGGISPTHRRFFNPEHYRIVLFDQRGAGKSTPLGEYRQNTTQLLVEDIEALRRLLGIKQWLVFGGSWGSTLALAYGEAHPQRCLGFVLRGIFLCTPAEIDWFMNGMRWFFPEVHAEFAAHVPAEERGDLLKAYEKRLFTDDPSVYLPAAHEWGKYEGSCLYLEPHPEAVAQHSSDGVAISVGRLEALYFLEKGFFGDDQLMRELGRIRHLPCFIAQGRYDVVCPPATAQRLAAAWPGSKLAMIENAGHAAMEVGTAAALVGATEAFRLRGCFE